MPLPGVSDLHMQGGMEWWNDEAPKYKSQISNESQVPIKNNQTKILQPDILFLVTIVPPGEGGLRGIENACNDGIVERWSDGMESTKIQITNIK
jgi:hypothetical protein